ncbi:COP1-interactive protein 1, partial [Striga asiatica]
MPKHRWRGSLQSFFGSHIDSEKDKELKGTRKEIEGKVQQILAALKEEDNNKGKEPLINLITDFHNHYQSLYARYDHLTDELRKKATGKKGDDSSSSSSDSSDSEDSPKKKGEKNGKVENDFENGTAGVKQELELALSEVTELRRKLTITSEEKEKLGRECGSALSKIEEAEKIISQINGEAEKFKSENSRLLAENGDPVKELESLRESQGETSKKLEEVILEREAGVLKVEEETKNLSIINSQLQNEKEAIQLELEALKGDFSSLREKLVSAENEVDKLSRMQKDTDEEKVGLLLKLKEKDDEIAKLLEEHKKLEATCKENLESSQKKTEELIQQLEKEIEIKDQEIVQLEDNIEDLKRELEMKDDEIKTMLENMRNIEVKQRLTSQKLRITEQLLSEKDESYLRKEEKLLEEQKSLKAKALLLSGIITVYKEAHAKIVSKISEKVNDTLAGFDAFHVKFEEDYGHLESRVYEISNELKAATSCMKKEIGRLVQELSVEKNKGLVLENKVGELEDKLQEDEDKRRSLAETVRLREEKVSELEKMVADMEEKMGDLERTMKEKETGFVNLSEEKREAIRQLSVLIEYHRNRYDDLKGMLAKTRGGINQVAV